jgi:hypothetical protein
MNDKTLADQPEVELDAEMAQRILDEGDNYSQQTSELVQFIYENKAAFREELLNRKLIQKTNDDAEGFDLAAVDGASAVESHGGGALVAAAAYKSSINDEKQRGIPRVELVPNHVDLEAFATLLRTHLELSLLAPDKLDADRLVILDHSFWGVMQAVSRALAAYKSQRIRLTAAKQNPDENRMQLAWKDVFKPCLGANGSFLQMIRNKQVISLSKKGISQYIVNFLLSPLIINDTEKIILGSTLNDRALLRHILRPGEFITPRSLYLTEQDESSIKSWKRSRFATQFDGSEGPDPFESREEVFDEYGLPRGDSREMEGRRLFVTYYLPHGWSRVYRIEFHERLLSNMSGPQDLSGNGERFQRVLASVRQSVNRETKEPLSQVLADLRAKAAVSSSVSMLPERAFYQLQDKYRDAPDMMDIVETLIDEERT